MNNLQRAQHKSRQLIAKAKRERDRLGYRENLGYDLRNRLADYICNLSLPYIDATQVLQEFDRACDTI